MAQFINFGEYKGINIEQITHWEDNKIDTLTLYLAASNNTSQAKMTFSGQERIRLLSFLAISSTIIL